METKDKGMAQDPHEDIVCRVARKLGGPLDETNRKAKGWKLLRTKESLCTYFVTILKTNCFQLPHTFVQRYQVVEVLKKPNESPKSNLCPANRKGEKIGTQAQLILACLCCKTSG
jgi:hypothetical protein